MKQLSVLSKNDRTFALVVRIELNSRSCFYYSFIPAKTYFGLALVTLDFHSLLCLLILVARQQGEYLTFFLKTNQDVGMMPLSEIPTTHKIVRHEHETNFSHFVTVPDYKLRYNFLAKV